MGDMTVARVVVVSFLLKLTESARSRDRKERPASRFFLLDLRVR